MRMCTMCFLTHVQKEYPDSGEESPEFPSFDAEGPEFVGQDCQLPIAPSGYP